MEVKALATRTASGLVYIAVIICGIIFGMVSQWALAALLGLLGVVELSHVSLTDASGSGDRQTASPSRAVTLATDCVAALLLISLPMMPELFWLLVPVLLFRGVSELYIGAGKPLRRLAVSALSLVYIAAPLALMSLISLQFGSTMPLLALFILIWVNDTGAFLVGSATGRHSLFKRLSPKKSWEGFFGGLALSVVAAVIMGLYFPATFALDAGVWFWAGLACVSTVFATWGDLFESMIKRSLHIKDSGHLIPGHGGILDRIDSLLFVLPAAYSYIMLYLTLP